jgi:RecB family exonuclease
VLKNQADCPFRAFANHRLGACKPIAPEIDVGAAERGILAHRALELFWKKTRNRARLRQLKDTNDLDSAVRVSAQRAVASVFTGNGVDARRQFARQETQRIAALLRDWLEIELLRPDFEVIEKEKSGAINIGGLELSIRIDRIDRVDSDKLILIDYKTGEFSTGDWFQERAQEPQLPLYALKYPAHGIACAVVKKHQEKMNFHAVARDPSIIKGCKPVDYQKSAKCANWDELMEYWRKNLTVLAERFLAGHLRVDPFKTPGTCRNCGLETLCRIGETNRALNSSEEDEES